MIVAAKKRRQSLSTRIQRTEQRLRLKELELLESSLADDSYVDRLVDPMELYKDTASGETWLPVGTAEDDAALGPYRDEAGLRLIRQRARIMALRNPYAENILNTMTSFLVGKGHGYNAVAKKGHGNAAQELLPKVNRFIRRLLKANKWKRRQKNIVRRLHRDGETFIRAFHMKDGLTKWRFIEPWEIKNPEVNDKDWRFGIHFDSDDAEEVIEYNVDGEYVDAEEIQHRKVNVDLNTPRGLSSLYICKDHLDRALRLLVAMSRTVQNQSKIAWIRKHLQSNKSQVQSYAEKLATVTRDNIWGEKERIQRLPDGGVVIDTNPQTEYDFPSTTLNASNPVAVLEAENRAAASSFSWPEYMLGSNAKNANYASTQVAENPGVKSLESLQDESIDDDLDLIWDAIEHAIDMDRLPEEVMALIDIEVKPPRLVYRNEKEQAEIDEKLVKMKAKSVQTVRTENQLDNDLEDQQIHDFEDEHGPAMDLDGGSGGGSLGSLDPDADAESELLERVGGITGTLEIMTMMNRKVITAGTAAALLVKFKIANDLNDANKIIGESAELPMSGSQDDARGKSDQIVSYIRANPDDDNDVVAKQFGTGASNVAAVRASAVARGELSDKAA